MPLDRNTTARKRFRQELDQLHAKIDMLPKEQQRELQRFVDTVEQRCQILRDSLSTIRDEMDDIRLCARAAQFNIEASSNEARQAWRRVGLSW